MRSIEEQTILVTGVTDGLGRRVAQDLAEKGATVLIHGRDAGRAGAAAREISGRTGNDKLRSHLADLSSLEEVRRLDEELRSSHERLDVLVNNAGVILPEREESRDGAELTRLLLPLLVHQPARIVNVASAAQSPIDFDDPMLEMGYDLMRAYAQSKLGMVMHTFDLAGELRGTGATVGLAVSPELEGVSGRYFDGKRGTRAQRQAYDDEARHKLRNFSEGLAGLLAGRGGVQQAQGAASQGEGPRERGAGGGDRTGARRDHDQGRQGVVRPLRLRSTWSTALRNAVGSVVRGVLAGRQWLGNPSSSARIRTRRCGR